MMISSEPDIQLDKSQLLEVFDKLNKELKNVFGTEGTALKCSKPISDAFIEWHEKTFPDLFLKKNPLYYYYMSEEQRSRLIEDTKDGISLPEGYSWGEADPEKDTQIIVDTWTYSGPGEYERIQ